MTVNWNLTRLWVLPVALAAASVCGAARSTLDVPGEADPRPGEQESAMERVLVTFAGRVLAIELVEDDTGVTWAEAIMETERDPDPVRIRIAPTQVLASEQFLVNVDDQLLIRAFSDETPLGAQCVRNTTTGHTLRLRCLHGMYVWSLRSPPADRAAAEPHRN